MWALPDITSVLFIAHHSKNDLEKIIKRTDLIFKSLKAYLKRAPSLKGAALVKLSSLRIQSELWRGFTNITTAAKRLESMDITSDNWFENMLKIFGRNRVDPEFMSMDANSHDARGLKRHNKCCTDYEIPRSYLRMIRTNKAYENKSVDYNNQQCCQNFLDEPAKLANQTG
ncbi:PREDICTED: uncharacterized protein LOC108365881 [Rhagoletis zephyria]|uniref:uncharacterized protein LOC108365881 n=1 Tax=Rhagoletis zephyria TaxID=28612 RepID=UPI000811416A|nr:PREDICTED: uncharacterized protein LOC108365881 [Rhagoletis zephyria]